MRFDWHWSKSLGRRQRAPRSRAIVPYRRHLRFEPLEDRRLLANVTVGNLNDVVNGTVTSIAALIGTPGADGISLREAIQAANADAAADTIGFGPTVTGTIQLTNVGHVGEIVVNNNLTINGPGASLLTIRAFAGTAAAGDGARIFNVDDGNAAIFKDVFISGLTLSGGDVASILGGGAISSRENLTVTALTITGNSAGSTTTGYNGGGIVNFSGSLTVNASTISGNTVLFGSGGGIFSIFGTMTISQSTISGNSVPGTGTGGGVYSNYSTTTIDSSTISGNSANSGGGVFHTGVGILTTITNSTISGNSARVNGGGVVALFGDVTVRHSTITLNKADSDNNATGNGGGVFVHSVLTNATIDHTIVAGNLRQVSLRDDVFGSVVASSAFNLVGVNTGLTGISNGMNGNQIGTGASPINPRLAPLNNNGGSTLTHAFLAGSPALDAGDPAAVAELGTVPLNDQRGATFMRVADGNFVSGARIDIGAFEQQTTQAANLVVDTLSDENDGNLLPGDFSLREALGFANTSIGLNTIDFAAALTSSGPATILLTLGELTISRSLSINGPGANLLAIDASGNDPTPTMDNGDGSRVLRIDNNISSSLINVSISGLTLTGGDTLGGGGIWSEENLTLTSCTITANSATKSGGGGVLMNRFGATSTTLTLNRSTVSGNLAGRGGGIYVNTVNVFVNDSTISSNLANGSVVTGGGGINQNFSNLTVTNSTISGNSTTGSGGGISFGSPGTFALKHSIVTGNVADSDNDGSDSGGGLFLYSGIKSLDHTIVAGNRRSASTRDDINGTLTASYSLIGDNTGATITDNGGNQIGTGAMPIDPMLGPLADNGGLTLTHALLVGSPAIDAGDPHFNPADPDGDPLTDDAVSNDQRGAPFTRVFDGNSNGVARIDIGAYELQPKGVQGDYNQNGIVDAADYTLWRDTLGHSGVMLFSGADGDGDGVVDQDDYGVWKAHFGQTLPPAAGSGATALVFSQSAVEVAGEVVGSARAQSTPATIDAKPDAARVARLTMFEAHAALHDSVSRPLKRINISAFSEPAVDNLLLLLAVDRVGRFSRQDVFVVDGRGSDEHRTDNREKLRVIDEWPTVALAEWPWASGDTTLVPH